MNLQELQQIKDRALVKMGTVRPRITVNMTTNSQAAGATEVFEVIKDELNKRQLKVDLAPVSGIGLMNYDPLIEVITPGYGSLLYAKVTPEKARTIIANHLLNHNPIYRWTIEN